MENANNTGILRRMNRGMALIEADYVSVEEGQVACKSTDGSKAYTFPKGEECPCEDDVAPCKHAYAGLGKTKLARLIKAEETLHPDLVQDGRLAYIKEQSRILEAQIHPRQPRTHFKPGVVKIRAKGANQLVLNTGELVKEAEFAFEGGSREYGAIRTRMGKTYDVTLKASASGPVHDLVEIVGFES
jgi:hypothetical protein